VIPLIHLTRLADDVGVVADLRNRHSVSAAVANARPAVVIHAAYARDEASIVDATQNVVDAALAVGAGLVHVSTDAVFCGDGLPRDEKAPADAVWDYGRWKARAEQVVTRGSASSAIVRLPLIVSLDPEDHVVACIRRGAANRQPTHWFDDEVRQPASVRELAGAVWDIASLDAAQGAGTWHLPGPESLTRYEIARRVVSELRLGSHAITAESTPRSAERPRHIHLLDERARRSIGWAPTSVLSEGRDSVPGAW
jgi:dTDP-4-dehydrorhamnose reductase